MSDHFKNLQFKRYKTFNSFSIHLEEFNVLVGTNNSGKSTIIGAFRLLAEGIRKARSKKPEYMRSLKQWAYHIPLNDVPIATENIFTDYDDSEPATVDFTLTSGNRLRLFFPENNSCYLVPYPIGRSIQSPSDFKRAFDVTIGFVPILGPVEHDEPLYQREAARSALLTHRASRNFRNIWYHYDENFDQFQRLVSETWPGMTIQKPVVELSADRPTLYMFCQENRIAREIYWAGFGFQVWCQMITYILRASLDAILIIDEPDIYLHSDLQRQLLAVLRDAKPDIMIATHSTEIITEAEPHELLVIKKGARSASRVKNVERLREIFSTLGSNLNPVLTQLAKTRKAIFVEGDDFRIIAAFARKLGYKQIANRADFAVIPAHGFNPMMVKNFKAGIASTVGKEIEAAIIFDRDYRSADEMRDVLESFDEHVTMRHIHSRKEIENYVLCIPTLTKAIENRARERGSDNGAPKQQSIDVGALLIGICEEMKSGVMSQHISHSLKYAEISARGKDKSTVTKECLEYVEGLWRSDSGKLSLVPGKEVLAILNRKLQEGHSFSISPIGIINEMGVHDVPDEMKQLVASIDLFRKGEG